MQLKQIYFAISGNILGRRSLQGKQSGLVYKGEVTIYMVNRTRFLGHLGLSMECGIKLCHTTFYLLLILIFSLKKET